MVLMHAYPLPPSPSPTPLAARELSQLTVIMLLQCWGAKPVKSPGQLAVRSHQSSPAGPRTILRTAFDFGSRDLTAHYWRPWINGAWIIDARVYIYIYIYIQCSPFYSRSRKSRSRLTHGHTLAPVFDRELSVSWLRPWVSRTPWVALESGGR